MPNPYRLDPSFEPIAYSLVIEPDLKRFAFTGSVSVTLKAAKPFSEITLHAIELKIKHAKVRVNGSSAWIAAERIGYEERYETATLRFPESVPASEGVELELDFSGLINDKMHGLYRTAYEVKGKKHWGAATQFEATDARRMFPCWDEPARKATFELTLRVPKDLVALSNMPAVGRKALPGGKLKEVRYEPTPRMSTYLLAFVIAHLESVEDTKRGEVPIRIWTTPGKKEQGRFALEVGRHALDYFARWFSIPYALPKLDMVALPDFASGAMENWGLVTYRETALLVDAKNSSVHARQRVADVIAHELAHQWFGNLVTMEWWTDLWLNEGFASYMGPKAVHDQFPDWQVWNQFIATEYFAALRDDSLKSSHPIEIPVQNPHEIREIFDHITYSKGSSVNRMLEHYLTEPVFRKGLSIYLKRHMYRNARTDELWTVLEEVSGKPVRAIMASFTRQEGYPVLFVRENLKGIEVEQHRFFFDGRKDRNKRRWSVPLVIQMQNAPKPVFAALEKPNAAVPLPATSGWIKVNSGQSGFYRTAYSLELHNRLVEALSASELPSTDCLGLLDDTLALARAGFVRTSAALDMVASCRGYTDYNVWLTAAGTLSAAESCLSETPAQDAIRSWARGLLQPLAEDLGWEPKPSEGHLDAMLRSLVIGRLGYYDDPVVAEEAQRRFGAFIKGGALSPDLRGAVYATVARHGGIAEFNQMLKIYRGSPLQEERVRVLRALTFFRRPEIIHKTLTFALSNEVRNQDAFMLLSGFGHNRVGRPIAWETVKRNWNKLVKRYASGGLGLMNRIIEGAAGGFQTEAEVKDVQRFFKAHPVPGTERAMKQTLEALVATLRWIKRDRSDVEEWVAARAATQALGGGLAEKTYSCCGA